MSAFGNAERKAATAVVAKATGTRFCSNHQGEAPLEGGVFTKIRIVRWMCAKCANNKIWNLTKR